MYHGPAFATVVTSPTREALPDNGTNHPVAVRRDGGLCHREYPWLRVDLDATSDEFLAVNSFVLDEPLDPRPGGQVVDLEQRLVGPDRLPHDPVERHDGPAGRGPHREERDDLASGQEGVEWLGRLTGLSEPPAEAVPLARRDRARGLGVDDPGPRPSLLGIGRVARPARSAASPSPARTRWPRATRTF